jgi:GNAT superfamily N-acetyltransferase
MRSAASFIWANRIARSRKSSTATIFRARRICWRASGREPVGAIRIRWFAGFAKLERAAVLRRYRDHGVAHALWTASAAIAAQKGYSQILGHIEPRLLGFWERCAGFRLREGRAPFRFSDREYVEVIAELPARADAITLNAPPLVLLRPEGAWDAPGVLDESVAREPLARSA